MAAPTPDLLWKRAGAAAFDLALGLVVWLVVSVVLGVLLGSGGIVLGAITTIGLGVFVHGVGQGRSGTTPGKSLVGLRCVGPDGRPPGTKAGLIRTAAWALDGFPYVVPGLAGFAMLLSTDNETRVGDRLAGTRVIDVRRAPASVTGRGTDCSPLAPGQPVFDRELGAFTHTDPLTGTQAHFDEAERVWKSTAPRID
jgi:uncharacterized RDD family membrane protein YckC